MDGSISGNRKIRILIVDDSSIIRTLLTAIFASDPELEVVGTAPDPYVGREKLLTLRPDVMTLDIEMPRMDGISFLVKVMEFMPTRTVIISSLSQKGSELAFKALEAGAIDVIAKPAINVNQNISYMADEIITRVKNAAKAKFQPIRFKNISKPQILIEKNNIGNASLSRTTHQILAIAASTGGTEALKEVLPLLPPNIPGTVLVQHMPPVFTKTFANTLNSLCPFEVKEAEDGDRVQPGRVLLAPGNFHMELTRSGAMYYVKLNQNPQQNGVRPAADPLFESVAKIAGKNAIGVVLTGMGRDGAQGLKTMRDAGSFNVAQDEASCVVFGMPKEAIAAGGINMVLPLHKIAGAIIDEINKRDVALGQS